LSWEKLFYFQDMKYDISNTEVVDRQSFITFLEKFREDYVQNKESWENHTLDRFLQAMCAYAEDVQGYYNNLKLNINADVPTWRVFADILSGAKVYE
jgi:hypothetical protein